MDYVLALILLRYKTNILVVETSFYASYLSFKIEYFAGLENHINQISKKLNLFVKKKTSNRKTKISPSNKSKRIIQTLNNLNLQNLIYDHAHYSPY